MPRVVVLGIPHHVTQRGNRREEDRAACGRRKRTTRICWRRFVLLRARESRQRGNNLWQNWNQRLAADCWQNRLVVPQMPRCHNNRVASPLFPFLCWLAAILGECLHFRSARFWLIAFFPYEIADAAKEKQCEAKNNDHVRFHKESLLKLSRIRSFFRVAGALN